jgi:hypothetical protein
MYQYKILKANSLINEDQLNSLSKEGWRLITIVKENKEFYFYFERNTISVKSVK